MFSKDLELLSENDCSLTPPVASPPELGSQIKWFKGLSSSATLQRVV